MGILGRICQSLIVLFTRGESDHPIDTSLGDRRPVTSPSRRPGRDTARSTTLSLNGCVPHTVSDTFDLRIRDCAYCAQPKMNVQGVVDTQAMSRTQIRLTWTFLTRPLSPRSPPFPNYPRFPTHPAFPKYLLFPKWPPFSIYQTALLPLSTSLPPRGLEPRTNVTARRHLRLSLRLNLNQPPRPSWRTTIELLHLPAPPTPHGILP